MAQKDASESTRLLPDQSYSSELRFSSSTRRPLMNSPINSSPDDEDNVRNAAVFSRYKYYSRLAPHPNNPMAIPDHVVPAEFWSHIPVQPKGKQGSLITIFSIWNTMMGTSLLSMPWALGQAGFALGLTLLIVMAFLTLYTSYRVMKSVDTIAHQGGDVLEFSDVCKHYLGRVGEVSAVIFSVVALLGGAVVYWVLMSNFLYNTVAFIYNDVEHIKQTFPDFHNQTFSDEYLNCTDFKPKQPPSTDQTAYSSLISYTGLAAYAGLSSNNNATTLTPPSLSDVTFHHYWDMQKTVPFFLMIILVPLINFKSPTFFTKFNALGTISVLYLIAFVTYKTAKWGFHMDFTKISGSYASISFPALTGVLSLAYFIHNCVLSIVRNQEKPENNARDLTIAFVCVAFTYCYVGCMFYSAWPMISKDCIDQNLLNNLVSADPLAFVARIFLFVQMLTVFPLLLYIMRIQVMHAVFGSIWPSWKHVVVLNAAVVGVCLIFARFLPQIGSIIRYTGAFCGLVYAFFLPCSTYILSEKNAGRLTAAKLIAHGFLILIGVANFIAQFLISD